MTGVPVVLILAFDGYDDFCEWDLVLPIIAPDPTTEMLNDGRVRLRAPEWFVFEAKETGIVTMLCEDEDPVTWCLLHGVSPGEPFAVRIYPCEFIQSQGEWDRSSFPVDFLGPVRRSWSVEDAADAWSGFDQVAVSNSLEAAKESDGK